MYFLSYGSMSRETQQRWSWFGFDEVDLRCSTKVLRLMDPCQEKFNRKRVKEMWILTMVEGDIVGISNTSVNS